ncbi:unnamed protein product [Triticum turgidum subsp. durum]|uniref:Uncharacterized protein n=1 Tax=Triticum turgidum subsp. durum TaxID=4567 RepID=A0A9R1BND7_TRITD|nr:unnamed protein product [Triticum turgidum subsp. durum]
MIQATSGESRHREAQPELPSDRDTLPSSYIQHSRPPKPTRDPPPMARVSGILSSPMDMPSSSRPGGTTSGHLATARGRSGHGDSSSAPKSLICRN